MAASFIVTEPFFIVTKHCANAAQDAAPPDTGLHDILGLAQLPGAHHGYEHRLKTPQSAEMASQRASRHIA
jgi:hypothetical protein